MAEACTCSENVAGGGVIRIKWDWTSSATGNVTAASVTGRVTTLAYTGKVLGFITDPAASTSDPTDNYNVTITDADSIDVLYGQGEDRDAATTEYTTDSELLGYVINSKLTLNVTGAGDTKGGVVYLFLEEGRY